MRASGIKTAMVTAITAITPDDPAHVKFTHFDSRGQTVPSVLPMRTYTVELGTVPRRSNTSFASGDWWISSFDVTAYYPASADDVESRIGDDMEKVSDALTALHLQDSEIYSAIVVPGVVSHFGEGLLAAVLNIEATYKGI